MESKFLTVQNKKLHYKSFVNKKENGKPIVLFIHGASPASQHTEFWSPLLPIIEKYCQPIFLDGYGHGLSDKPNSDENLSIEGILLIYKEFITGILKAESIDNFIMIGRSLGGLVTHNLSKEFESMLLAIGLIAPAGCSKVPNTLKDWTKKVSVLWDTEDPIVGFTSYSYIQSTVKQNKLFCIGEEGTSHAFQVTTRDKTKNPSHAPELSYPETFEAFLRSLVD